MPLDLSEYAVTGTNNPNKQVSVTKWNNLLAAIASGVNAGGGGGGPAGAELDGFAVNAANYGLVPDYDGTTGTDNYAAFVAMLDAVKAMDATPIDPLYPRGPMILIPAGRYYMSQTIHVKQILHLQAIGSGFAGNAGAQFVFPPNVTGMIFHRFNTVAQTGSGAATTGSDGSVINGLMLVAKAGATQGNDACGFFFRTRADMEHCSASGFARDGCAIVADEGGDTLGNANGFKMRTCWFGANGRHGLYVKGDNANACIFEGVDTVQNGEWGKKDETTIGNMWVGGQDAANGSLQAGIFPTTSIVTMGTPTGPLYSVVPGQLAAAPTTEPGTNAAVWQLLNPSVDTVGNNAQGVWPQWTNGMALVEGGAAYIYAGYMLNPYVEAGSQPPIWLGPSSGAVNGSKGFDPIGPGATAWQESRSGGWSIPNLASEVMNVTGSVQTLGKADASLSYTGYYNALNQTELAFRSWNGGFQLDGTITVNRGGGATYYNRLLHTYQTNVGTVGYVTDTGFDTPVGKYYKVNNQQVVGARQAAIADATDAASTQARLNDVLAALRTHGLIAT